MRKFEEILNKELIEKIRNSIESVASKSGVELRKSGNRKWGSWSGAFLQWYPIGKKRAKEKGTYSHPSTVNIEYFVHFWQSSNTRDLIIFDLNSVDPPGYGELIVKGMLRVFPPDSGEIHIYHDTSNGFWKHMKEKYSQYTWSGIS